MIPLHHARVRIHLYAIGLTDNDAEILHNHRACSGKIGAWGSSPQQAMCILAKNALLARFMSNLT